MFPVAFLPTILRFVSLFFILLSSHIPYFTISHILYSTSSSLAFCSSPSFPRLIFSHRLGSQLMWSCISCILFHETFNFMQLSKNRLSSSLMFLLAVSSLSPSPLFSFHTPHPWCSVRFSSLPEFILLPLLFFTYYLFSSSFVFFSSSSALERTPFCPYESSIFPLVEHGNRNFNPFRSPSGLLVLYSLVIMVHLSNFLYLIYY
uniref:Uncharacterized protein n=1 Tax=Cacopsylla melanoneura TaxID=428564 RepID=A0A8D8W2R2_9HEMI